MKSVKGNDQAGKARKAPNPPDAEPARKKRKKGKGEEALLELDGVSPSSESTIVARAQDLTSSKMLIKSAREPGTAALEAQPSKQPRTVRADEPGSGEPEAEAGGQPLARPPVAEPPVASTAVKKRKGTVENGAISAPVSAQVGAVPEDPGVVPEPAKTGRGPRSGAFDPNSEEYYTPEGVAERKRVKREKRAQRRQQAEAPGELNSRGTGEGQPAPHKPGIEVIPAAKTVSSGLGSDAVEGQHAGGPAGGQQDKKEKKKRKKSKVDKLELISGPGNAAEAMAIRQKLGVCFPDPLPARTTSSVVPPRPYHDRSSVPIFSLYPRVAAEVILLRVSFVCGP